MDKIYFEINTCGNIAAYLDIKEYSVNIKVSTKKVKNYETKQTKTKHNKTKQNQGGGEEAKVTIWSDIKFSESNPTATFSFFLFFKTFF